MLLALLIIAATAPTQREPGAALSLRFVGTVESTIALEFDDQGVVAVAVSGCPWAGQWSAIVWPGEALAVGPALVKAEGASIARR